jgi:hypothetical protein
MGILAFPSQVLRRSQGLKVRTPVSFSASSVRMFTGSIDVTLGRRVVLPVGVTKFIGPPCRLHEQHKAVIGG